MEKMHLEYQRLLAADPELEEKLNKLPGRVFSGKSHPKKDTKAVFFCYALPRADLSAVDDEGKPEWTEEAGECKWYLYDLSADSIHDEPTEIVDVIRSKPATKRRCIMEQTTLGEIRKKVEKHIKNIYFRRVQAPVGIKPRLKAWMELN